MLDEDLSYRVAEGLRQRGVDAVSVHEISRSGSPDEDQLTFATAERRALVTYNRADFQSLDAQWRAQGRTHAGVLWCVEKGLPRRDVGSLVRALENTARTYESLEGLCLTLTRAVTEPGSYPP
jgi:predicted nuclease of predicted toxin-antitoxin system